MDSVSLTVIVILAFAAFALVLKYIFSNVLSTKRTNKDEFVKNLMELKEAVSNTENEEEIRQLVNVFNNANAVFTQLKKGDPVDADRIIQPLKDHSGLGDDYLEQLIRENKK